MDKEKIVSLRGHKRGIFGTIDDKAAITGKNMSLITIKSLWIPAFAGMTAYVGGSSH